MPTAQRGQFTVRTDVLSLVCQSPTVVQMLHTDWRCRRRVVHRRYLAFGSEPMGFDAARPRGVGARGARGILACETSTTNGLRPPAPSRLPRIMNARATSSVAAVNGLGNLVMAASSVRKWRGRRVASACDRVRATRRSWCSPLALYRSNALVSLVQPSQRMVQRAI